jgi:diguanylate cyclase (GGDEF)-like protein
VAGVPEALRLMRSWQPDLVLIDLAVLPRERSTVLADLRDPLLRDLAPRDLPVVVAMTAEARGDSGPDALRAGAADIVRKPFRDEELVQRVRNLLAVRVLDRRWQERSAQLEGLAAGRLRDLEQQRRFLHAVLDGLDDGIVACDGDGRVALANAAATRLGLGPADGATLPAVMPGTLRSADGGVLPVDDDPLRQAFTGYRVVGQELRVSGPGDDPRIVVVSGRPIVSDPGDRIGAVVSLHDITDRRRVEEELRRQMLYDGLTGLANRALFLDRLTVALARTERDHRPMAVLLFDVDDFAELNDRFGHEAADAVLVLVAQRITATLRPGDSGARLDGDEFAVLCESPVGETTARRIAERIRSRVCRPIEVAGVRITLRLSIGIAVQRDAGRTCEEVLQDAHAAAFQARQRGGGRPAIFESAHRQELLERMDVAAALRHAVPGGELRLHYQPTVDLRTGRVVGAEALVRWQRPGEGLLLPLRFLPVAEQTGLIAEVGQWVLRAACAQLVSWQRTPLLDPDFVLSVNLSAREASEAGLAELMDQILADTRANPEQLCLEVAETTLVHDHERVAPVLRAARERGLQVAVDDVGSGGAPSLAYLRWFDVQVLKVDRSVVTAMASRGGGDAETIDSVIDLSRQLGLATVAEGVETDRQAAALVARGCELAQGFYYSAAVPAERFVALLGPQPPGPR